MNPYYEARRDLETAIFNLIRKFEETTELSVVEVNLDKTFDLGQPSRVVGVRVEAQV